MYPDQCRDRPEHPIFSSPGIRTVIPVAAIHWQNVEFKSYWPMYLGIALACGLLAANYLSMFGALLVHATLNLLGVSFVSALNRSSPMMSTYGARACLFICLVVFTVIFM